MFFSAFLITLRIFGLFKGQKTLPEHVTVKDDFQSVLRYLRTLIFININGSLDVMRIDVIR